MNSVKAIRDILDEQGRDQSWLARQMNISKSLLSLLLKGEREWRPEHRANAARALGIPEYLIFECQPVADVQINTCTGAVSSTEQTTCVADYGKVSPD